MQGEDKNKDVWPGGFPEAKSVEEFDFFMTGKNGGPITKIPKSRLAEVVGVVGESMPAIQGGTTPATAVALPAGPVGQNRFFDASWGYWKYNNVVLKNPKGGDGIPEGSEGTIYWNGTTSVCDISKMQALLKVEGTDVLISEEVPKGKAVTAAIDPFKRLTEPDTGEIVVDKSKTTAGYISYTSGNFTDSNNWIYIPYVKVPERIKGKLVKLHKTGSVPGSGAMVAFKTASGIYMNNDSIPGNSIASAQDIEVFVPESADTWAFTLVNDSSNDGVGTRPTNNPYYVAFSVVYEDSDSLKIKPDSIKNTDSIKFTNEITEKGEGAVPAKEVYKVKSKIDSITIDSKNILDTSVDIVRGYWNLSGVHNNSINWIKTVRKRFPENVIRDLEDGKDVFFTLSGGGNVPTTGSLAVFWDEKNSVAAVAGSGSSTYTKTIKLNKEWRDFALTVANQSTNGGIGTRPHDNNFTNTFQAEIGDKATPYMPKGVSEISLDKLPYNTREIILKKVSADFLEIYYHIGGDGNLWFKINIRKVVNPVKFVDVWRLDSGFVVRRFADMFTDVREVILTGVWENAIYTTGANYTDALGSSHGWESLVNNGFSLFMDAKSIDMELLDVGSLIKGSYLTFQTKTEFKNFSGTAAVGTSIKKWTIKDGELTIQNNINWLATINLLKGSKDSGAFITMCSVARSDSSGNITHSAISNEDGTIYDVSTSGFVTKINTDYNNQKRNQIVLWGDMFKAEITIIKKMVILADGTVFPNGYSDSGAHIKNSSSPNYNKNYFAMGGSQVNNGDYWHIESKYRFSNF